MLAHISPVHHKAHVPRPEACGRPCCGAARPPMQRGAKTSRKYSAALLRPSCDGTGMQASWSNMFCKHILASSRCHHSNRPPHHPHPHPPHSCIERSNLSTKQYIHHSGQLRGEVTGHHSHLSCTPLSDGHCQGHQRQQHQQRQCQRQCQRPHCPCQSTAPARSCRPRWTTSRWCC